MKKKMRRLIVKILYYLPKKIAHKILYFLTFRKKLDLKNPKNFNEKIQWLMINEYNQKYSDLADKYKVREFIKSKGYEKILPQLYAVYKKAEDIKFDNLPNRFVLKPNNGCGNIFICKDKKNFNKEEAQKNLNIALKSNFAKKNLEHHYKNIKPLIICEEYLDDKKNIMPQDYKIYCYNGVAKCILVCTEREKELRLDYFDLDWNYIEYAKEEYRSNKKIEKPRNLDTMIKIAEDLSNEFKFVRVDLYNIDGRIYFGELTFTPACGLVNYNTDEALEILGSYIGI